jgi:hypothetical protein
MHKYSVVLLGIRTYTQEVVINPTGHRTILNRANTPNGNAIVFDVVKEVLVQRIATVSIVFVQLPNYSLHESFFPRTAIVQQVYCEKSLV